MAHNPLHDQALAYHRRLPGRIWGYLRGRGIVDEQIHRHLLGWDGHRITIPITNREGQVAFFKLARDPEDKTDSPKILATPGASVELYGWERVLARPEAIIICEGEFDRLVLESRGFAAVTGTGGAATFRPEWAEELCKLQNVYICFDNDIPGQDGAVRVAQLIPHARIVRLPTEVGEAGDVTDFFARLKRTREDFLRLLEEAQPLPEIAAPSYKTHSSATNSDETARLRSSLPIESLVKRYVPLRPCGRNYVARCPFHDDHNPSFVVFPATQSFYCFGCEVHGDAFAFLMRVEHLTFREAKQVIQQLVR